VRPALRCAHQPFWGRSQTFPRRNPVASSLASPRLAPLAHTLPQPKLSTAQRIGFVKK